ncbi:SH3 domain-containing protein [Chondrinema litorale]|uniref:SH3 domain-containing protein n=1 Tax=Chondrinema litorale TaxID=2994555 RepID=UPI00254302E1|nr:SH3 domain-containing protein [Chondrinema litorale]UZR96234.1 SH3 domain-containing protein [Chondrinema litorale]
MNDPDGYTNLRLSPSGKSDIIGVILSGQTFNFYPDINSDWWKVDFEFRTGYVHKSRIKYFDEVESEISKLFLSYVESNPANVEFSEMNSELLFEYAQNFPLATLTAFCKQPDNVKSFLISKYQTPINDGIDLQLIYSRLVNVKSLCFGDHKITDALKVAAKNSDIELKNLKSFVKDIHDLNRPDKYSTLTNHMFVSELEGKPITYYLNHADIDVYAKMFYQGQFALSDDDLTFSFLDSLLTTNPDTKPFYFHIFNCIVRVSDGALSEIVSGYCNTYFEKYPCDFIAIKARDNYSELYTKWINFTAYEYYFEFGSIDEFNNKIDEIEKKVKIDCEGDLDEIGNIRVKITTFLQKE